MDGEPAKYSVRLTPIFDLKKQLLHIDFESKFNGMASQISRETLNFKDQCVRQALIALGWTPPKEKKE